MSRRFLPIGTVHGRALERRLAKKDLNRVIARVVLLAVSVILATLALSPGSASAAGPTSGRPDAVTARTARPAARDRGASDQQRPGVSVVRPAPVPQPPAPILSNRAGRSTSGVAAHDSARPSVTARVSEPAPRPERSAAPERVANPTRVVRPERAVAPPTPTVPTRVVAPESPAPGRTIVPKTTAPPRTAVPERVVPERVVPERGIPGRAIPERVIPETITRDRIAPERIAPDPASPGKVAPGSAVPERVAPVGTAEPERVAPERVVPPRSDDRSQSAEVIRSRLAVERERLTAARLRWGRIPTTDESESPSDGSGSSTATPETPLTRPTPRPIGWPIPEPIILPIGSTVVPPVTVPSGPSTSGRISEPPPDHPGSLPPSLPVLVPGAGSEPKAGRPGSGDNRGTPWDGRLAPHPSLSQTPPGVAGSPWGARLDDLAARAKAASRTVPAGTAAGAAREVTKDRSHHPPIRANASAEGAASARSPVPPSSSSRRTSYPNAGPDPLHEVATRALLAVRKITRPIRTDDGEDARWPTNETPTSFLRVVLSTLGQDVLGASGPTSSYGRGGGSSASAVLPMAAVLTLVTWRSLPRSRGSVPPEVSPSVPAPPG